MARHTRDTGSRALWAVVPAVATTLATVLTLTFPIAGLFTLALVAALWLSTRSRQGIRGAAVGVALAALMFLGSNSAPPTARVGAVAIAVAVLAWVAIIATKRQGRPRPAVILLLVYMTYAALISVVTGASSMATIAVALSAVAAVALVAQRFTLPDYVELCRWAVGIGIVQVGIAFCELFVFSEPIWGIRNVTSAGVPVFRYNPFLGDIVLRTQGTFGHPIPFALFMLTVLFLCLAPALRGHRLLRFSGISIALVGLFLSGTRSAAIAASIGMIYYLISSTGLAAKTRNAALIGVAVVVILVGDFGIRTITFNLLSSDSLAHRVDGWTLATGLLTRGAGTVLFGSGMNSEVATFEAGYLQQDGFQVIDNQWLTLFVTTGLVGTVLFGLAIAMSLWKSDRARRALILSMLVMFFSFDVTTWPTAFALLAIAIALPSLSAEPSSAHGHAGRLLTAAALSPSREKA